MASITTAPHRPPTGVGRRRQRNRLTWGLCTVALALVVIPVVWIVGGVIDRTVSHFHFSLLTTYPVGNGGGLLNSIEGTFVLVIGVLILAGAVGLAGGIYLAEYAGEGRGQILRGASEVLAGVPSIILGYVGFIGLVMALHWGYSLYAGIIVLSVLVVPYITKTTEVALRNVPTSYREGGEALGMRSGYLLRKLVLRPALPGITTGLIIAVAISVGETAPLLYTAGYNEKSPTFGLHDSPAGYLTYNVLNDYNQPSTFLHQRANAAALLLIILVLALIVVARMVVMLTQRHSPDRPQRIGKSTG
jgi:phosphate transport system permease protein